MEEENEAKQIVKEILEAVAFNKNPCLYRGDAEEIFREGWDFLKEESE